LWTVVAEEFAFIVICNEKKNTNTYFLLYGGDEKGVIFSVKNHHYCKQTRNVETGIYDEKLFSLGFRAIIRLNGYTAVIIASNLLSHLMDSIKNVNSLINPRF